MTLVAYNHNPSDLAFIYLAAAAKPAESDWAPAIRDTVDGRRIVLADLPDLPNRRVWLRDRNGERQVIPL